MLLHRRELSVRTLWFSMSGSRELLVQLCRLDDGDYGKLFNKTGPETRLSVQASFNHEKLSMTGESTAGRSQHGNGRGPVPTIMPVLGSSYACLLPGCETKRCLAEHLCLGQSQRARKI